MEWLCNCLSNLLNAENIASFLTTAAGVFSGFFLSVHHYNKKKKEAANELELTYIALINKEFQIGLTAFDVSLNNIDYFLSQHSMVDNRGDFIGFDRITENEIDEDLIQDIIVDVTLYLDSMITNNALLSASKAGATEVILLDEVVNAYNSYNVTISKAKMHANKFSAAIASALWSEKSNVVHYLNILMDLKTRCTELNEAYQKAIEALEVLETNIHNR